MTRFFFTTHWNFWVRIEENDEVAKYLYCQIGGGANWHSGTKIYICVECVVLGS